MQMLEAFPLYFSFLVQALWLITPVIQAFWEAKVSESWGQEFKTSLVNMVKLCLYFKKIQKISRAWWYTPVIPAASEAEAAESLELRRRRLWWAEITPLHSSLGDRVRVHLKKKNAGVSDLPASAFGFESPMLHWFVCNSFMSSFFVYGLLELRAISDCGFCWHDYKMLLWLWFLLAWL